MIEFLSYRIEHRVLGSRFVVEARKGDTYYTIECDAPRSFDKVLPLIELLKSIDSAPKSPLEFGDLYRPPKSGRTPSALKDIEDD